MWQAEASRCKSQLLPCDTLVLGRGVVAEEAAVCRRDEELKRVRWHVVKVPRQLGCAYYVNSVSFCVAVHKLEQAKIQTAGRFCCVSSSISLSDEVQMKPCKLGAH